MILHLDSSDIEFLLTGCKKSVEQLQVEEIKKTVTERIDKIETEVALQIEPYKLYDELRKMKQQMFLLMPHETEWEVDKYKEEEFIDQTPSES